MVWSGVKLEVSRGTSLPDVGDNVDYSSISLTAAQSHGSSWIHGIARALQVEHLRKLWSSKIIIGLAFYPAIPSQKVLADVDDCTVSTVEREGGGVVPS